MGRGKKKAVKKLIAYLLTFALAIPFSDLVAERKTAEAKDTILSSDGNWWYALNDDGTAEICGMYLDSSDLVIPATVDGFQVTSIGENVFYGRSSLSKVEIPNSVTSIGNFAFSGCDGLSKVEIPNSVTSVGEGAFMSCSSLNKVEIPNSVTSIGDRAFERCSSLSKVEIPSSVANIGGWVFWNCTSLSEVEISAVNIGYSMFDGCTNLSKLKILNGVTNIGDWAFGRCRSLSEVEIPNSVINIGGCAFYDCSGLSKAEISNSVVNIGNMAFCGCSSLSKVEIPNSVTSISDNAFNGCSSLSKVEIPNSVVSIGMSVFSNCTNLREVEISVADIGIGAFSNCTNLSKLQILNGVANIGKMAFNGCNSLSKVEIPNSVTNIGEIAFASCSSLSEVKIPSSVTSIGGNAFWDCASGFLIHTSPGSYAETYAKSNGIKVQTDLGSSLNPVSTPTPPSTPTPTPAMGVTFAPVITESTPTPTPTPKLGLKLDRLDLSADAQGNFADNRVSVSLTDALSFTVSTDVSWLKVCKKDASASADRQISFYNDTDRGNASFYVFADENISITPQIGEITVKAKIQGEEVAKTVTVRQEASKAVLSLSVKKITANVKGKTSVSSVEVDTNKTGGFSVSNDGNSWIKLGSSSYASPSSKVSFESGGTFYVFISDNPSDEARAGQIVVTHEDGETQETIEVTQEGAKASLSVDSTSKTADDSGYFYSNAVYVKTSGTGAFTAAVEDVGWLKVSRERSVSFADGMDSVTLDGDSYIYLVADKNSGEERTATITISHAGGSLSKTVTVTQLGKSASYLEVDREAAYFDEPLRAIDGPVHISASEDTKWTVTASESWIKILKDNWYFADEYASIEGMGAGSFYILVKENDTYQDRSGYITVSAPGLESYRIEVHQVENEVPLDVLLQELTIRVTKKTFKKGKTTQIKLNYPEGLYASDIKSVKFSSNKKKVATVNSKGVVKGIKKGKAVITVKVTLENGSSRTFKAKITVDKRKVKLSKFK